jgi:hypothetical protein
MKINRLIPMPPHCFRSNLLKAEGVMMVIVMILCLGCTNLFLQPAMDLVPNPNLSRFQYEEVHFASQDGVALHGWFLQGKGKHRGVILFLHGNAQNISTHVNNVLWLVADGYDVFAPDYRGYGRSEGRPSVEGVHRDAEAALKYLMGKPFCKKEQIVLLGQSLGGAIAIYTVAHLPDKSRIAAVIADSPFASYRMIAREKLAGIFLTWPFQYPLSMLFNDDYSPLKCVKDVSPVPLLFLHGTRDRVVPVQHSRILFQEALLPKEMIESDVDGHINFFSSQSNRDKLLNFLSQALPGAVSE